MIYHLILAWIFAFAATEASSDLVNIYYQLYRHATSSGSGSLSNPEDYAIAANQLDQAVSVEIASKLEPFGLSFDALPNLLQRALLWDGGYASADNGSVARIYTSCTANTSGAAMTGLALETTLLENIGCQIHECSREDRPAAAWSFSSDCGPSQIDAITRCACTSVKTQAEGTPLWTTNDQTNSSYVPNARIRRHIWSDVTAGRSAILYAIHIQEELESMNTKNIASSEICSSQTYHLQLTIPCIEHHTSDTRWCRPRSTPLMTRWLKEYTLALIEKQLELAAPSESAEFESDNSFSSSNSNTSVQYNKNGSVLVESNETFRYDGKSSDLAQQFYRRYLAGDNVQRLDFNRSQLPSEIQNKLVSAGLSFTQLSPLLQRALLWDSGYVFQSNSSSTLVAIYTRCGLSMAEIAIPKHEIEETGCETQSCGEKTLNTTNRLLNCTSNRIRQVARCAASGVPEFEAGIAMWADAGNADAVPDVTIVRHKQDGYNKIPAAYSLHTVRGEIGRSTCSERYSAAGMVIPCTTYLVNTTDQSAWCRPMPGALVTSWLAWELASITSTNLLQEDSTSGIWHQTVPVLIVGGFSLLVTATAVFIYLRRRSKEQRLSPQHLSERYSDNPISSAWTGHLETQFPEISPNQSEDVFGNPPSIHAFLAMLSSSPTVWSSSPLSLSLALTAESLASGSPHRNHGADLDVLDMLANDAQLKHAQIPFNQLQFHHLIARGIHSEIWLCVLHNRCVAVKKLPKKNHSSIGEINTFLRVIRLGAPLQHPNILSFIGVAWSSLQNLCLVTEYLEHGDLHEYLLQTDLEHNNNFFTDFMCFSLSWKREKVRLALDVAQGLAYLHQHYITHKNLKTNNVLLSANLDAKLKGFGVSCPNDDKNPTGSQMPFWTAPEVLSGGSYSEKSDVYSFGVVLTELDTHESPYADAVTSRGDRMPPLQKLQRILAGDLKPSLTSTCPDEIVNLVDSCLHRDPSVRPSVKEVVQAVRDIPGVNLEVFSL